LGITEVGRHQKKGKANKNEFVEKGYGGRRKEGTKAGIPAKNSGTRFTNEP